MLAVRPPEYFPGIPFWALLARVDTFVLADTFQYSRQSFQNRAKIRTPQGWQWISIPLAARQHGEPICRVQIDTAAPWRAKHLRAMGFNYRSSPYFEYYEEPFVRFLDTPWSVLGDATIASIRLIHHLLELETDIVLASELPDRPTNLRELSDSRAGPWIGLSDTIEHDRAAGLDVEEFSFDPPEYHQNFPGFESGMSILDVLFNKGPETGRMFIDG